MHSSLFAVATSAGPSFPSYFVLVYVVGFIAAVSIGSLAWYNSKRPAGWEAAERPNVIPEIDTEVKKEE
ncbi:MAG: hypothetical protein AAGD25_05430 [Cyanobacteria bacterium P01_F01_bin.150]